MTVAVKIRPPQRWVTAAANSGRPDGRRRSYRVNAAAPAKTTGVRQKAGKKTGLRTEAFIARMAWMATRGSASSRPYMVEQTQAKKQPEMVPASAVPAQAQAIPGVIGRCRELASLIGTF